MLLLEDCHHISHRIKESCQKFLKDELIHSGLDFKVWEWDLDDLYGFFLGMFIDLNLVHDSKSVTVLLDYSKAVLATYHDNPYHSKGHAFDVAYMTYYMIKDLSITAQMNLKKYEMTALLLGALAHDMDHPGLNNNFQMNAKTSLAIKYQNISILENNSIDQALELLDTMGLLQILYENESDIDFCITQTKELIRFIILETDMVHHFSLGEELTAFVESQNASAKSAEMPLINEESCTVASTDSLLTVIDAQGKHRRIILAGILHAADISNPARPFDICKKWSDCVGEEFFNQGAEEKKRNLPISPNMDRESSNQIKTQLGFAGVIVRPFFECLAALFPKIQIFITLLEDNARNWNNLLKLEENEKSDDLPKPLFNPQLQKKGGNRKVSIAAGTVEISDSAIERMSGLRARLCPVSNKKKLSTSSEPEPSLEPQSPITSNWKQIRTRQSIESSVVKKKATVDLSTDLSITQSLTQKKRSMGG